MFFKIHDIKKNYTALFFSAIFFLFVSCTTHQQPLIIGNWELQSAEIKPADAMPGNPDDVKGQLYSFNEDNSFYKTDPKNGHKKKGAYKITKENNRSFLTFTDLSFPVDTKSEIIKLDQTSLILKIDFGNVIYTMSFVRK
ncbi:MAG: hypothetical protein ABJA78_13085 [Ferruginibacter sp.]